MFKKSKYQSLYKICPRNTCETKRTVFKTDHCEGTLYKRSPYFQGCKLWDSLSIDDIEVPDIFACED